MARRFPILRKLMLLIGDMFFLSLATYVAIHVAVLTRPFHIDVNSYYMKLPFMLITAGILFNVNGLFSIVRKRYSEIILSMAVALFNLFIIMLAASFFLREFTFSRSVLMLMIFFQFVFLAIWKYFSWRLEKAFIEPRNALVVGSRKECERIIARLQLHPQLHYRVRYACTAVKSSNFRQIEEDIDLVIIGSDLHLKDKAALVRFCHMNGKKVVLVPEFYELFCSGVELDKIDDIPVFHVRYLMPTLEQRVLKRSLDIIVAICGLVLLSPVMGIVAMAIKLDSPGSVLYSQIRTGKDEKQFKIYKFRSMKQNAEKHTGPVLAIDNDPRITRLGALLRATRLDELPQLFNVLIGDMSIVGPRPERPYFVEQLKTEIPEYVYRHSVKPGITGMAQVYGKYNTSPYDKLIYDLMYVQKCNVLTDLVIMLQTVQVLVTKESTAGVMEKKQSVDILEYEVVFEEKRS